MKVNNKTKTLIIAVNEDVFFLSHRRDIGLAALKNGWRVVVTCADTGMARKVRSLGFIFEEMPIVPRSMSLANLWKVSRHLRMLMKKYPYSIVHLVGMKLILAGNMATKFSPRMKVRGLVNAVSGMGVLFINESRSLPAIILRILRRVKNKSIPSRTIFQNEDDEALFQKYGLLKGNESVYIKGSGVNLTEYRPANKTSRVKNSHSSPIVLFAGRLLKSKGVNDFIEAAEILRHKWEGKAEFLICGGLSTKKDSITQTEMKLRTDGTYLRWFGMRKDMPRILRRADIMAYPSYYREGVPRILLEASASALPLITCDSVGCRDTVIEGHNGFLIQPKNPEELAAVIERLLVEKGLRMKMGYESRKMAERDYNIEDVVRKHMEIYEGFPEPK